MRPDEVLLSGHQLMSCCAGTAAVYNACEHWSLPLKVVNQWRYLFGLHVLNEIEVCICSCPADPKLHAALFAKKDHSTRNACYL